MEQKAGEENDHDDQNHDDEQKVPALRMRDVKRKGVCDNLNTLVETSTDPKLAEKLEKLPKKIDEARRQELEAKVNTSRAPPVLVSQWPGDLPQILRNKIESTGGVEVNFVLRKRFFGALRGRSLRLTIASDQTKFLRDDERKRLDGRKRILLPVKLIDQRCTKEYDNMKFKRWDGRTNGKIYALTKAWHEVVRDNGLKDGDEIKLWSFRVDNKLHFALQSIKTGM